MVDINPNLAVLASFDWYFLDEDEFGDSSYYEIAGSVLYRFQAAPIRPHLGGGLVLGHGSSEFAGFEASDSDTGIALLGGATFEMNQTRVIPFADLRIALSGPEQFVLSGGVYF
jgi:hypothetical protein